MYKIFFINSFIMVSGVIKCAYLSKELCLNFLKGTSSSKKKLSWIFIAFPFLSETINALKE